MAAEQDPLGTLPGLGVLRASPRRICTAIGNRGHDHLTCTVRRRGLTPCHRPRSMKPTLLRLWCSSRPDTHGNTEKEPRDSWKVPIWTQACPQGFPAFQPGKLRPEGENYCFVIKTLMRCRFGICTRSSPETPHSPVTPVRPTYQRGTGLGSREPGPQPAQ